MSFNSFFSIFFSLSAFIQIVVKKKHSFFNQLTNIKNKIIMKSLIMQRQKERERERFKINCTLQLIVYYYGY